MSKCYLCGELSSNIITYCSHEEHIVCRKCYESAKDCKICLSGPYIKDERITLEKGRYPYHNIWDLVKPYAIELGMIYSGEGYTMWIDPVKTVIETEEGLILNLLQYVILMEECTSIHSMSIEDISIFTQAFYSLLCGLEEGVKDIASLYYTHFCQEEMEKSISKVRRSSSDILYERAIQVNSFIKGSANREYHISVISKWYKNIYSSQEIDDALSLCIERGWIQKKGDLYKYIA